MAALYTSYETNKNAIDAVALDIHEAHKLANQAAIDDDNWHERLVPLDRILSLQHSYQDRSDVPLWMRFGLYRGHTLERALAETYDRLLRQLVAKPFGQELLAQLRRSDSIISEVYYALGLLERLAVALPNIEEPLSNPAVSQWLQRVSLELSPPKKKSLARRLSENRSRSEGKPF